MSGSPPFDMVEIEDGRRLHVYCDGPIGAPFVLYDAGAFGIYADGWWIKEELKTDHRVCVFDRAGMGWSDPLPEGVAPTADWHVEDMRRLRRVLGYDEPFVLVGHSMAGLRLHAYANMYPEELKGLVFIDAANPRTLSKSRIAAITRWIPPAMSVGVGLARIGIMGGLSRILPPKMELPDQQAADKRRSMASVRHQRSTKAEIDAVIKTGVDFPHFQDDGADRLPVSVFTNTPGGGNNAPTANAARAHTGFGRITALPDETHVSLLNRENSKRTGADVRAIFNHAEAHHE